MDGVLPDFSTLALGPWGALATMAGMVVLGGVSALAVHEGGHALAALAAGGRVTSLVCRGLHAAVHAQVPAEHRALFFAAGVAANVVCAAFFGLGPGLWRVVAGIHLLHAAFALWPERGSDGAQLLELWHAARARARARTG